MNKYTIVIGLIIMLTSQLYSQQFTFQSENPFGIKVKKDDNSRAANAIFFYDYDSDGDQDLFLTGFDFIDNVPNPKWINMHFFIEMQTNIGSPTAPSFGPRQDVFPFFPYPTGYFFPTMGDLNHDGKADLICSAQIDVIGNEKLRMMVNNGTVGPGQFMVSTLDAMGLEDFVPESFFAPHLVDLDGDGDLDLMASGFNSAFAEEDGDNIPIFYYAKNTGTPTVPNFVGWYAEPYGLESTTPWGELLSSGDINNDGHVDLIGALMFIPTDSNNYLTVRLNHPGGNGKPAFDPILSSPYGLPMSHGNNQLISPALVDIDGDGDLDFFVMKGTASSSVVQYYVNTLCQPSTTNSTVAICEGDSYTLGNTTLSAAGLYVIHLESIQHCDSTINLTLIVNPIPTMQVDATICSGEAYVVGNESFTSPGSYQVLLTSITGCDSLVQLTLTVHEIDPLISLTDHTLIAQESGATYQWYDCDSGQAIAGAVNQSYDVTVTGSYGVHLSDAFGCHAESNCVTVTITGLEDDLASNAISIYPQPTSGMVFIKNNSGYTVAKLTVINSTGQILKSFSMKDNTSVDLSSLEAGVYFIRLSGEGFDFLKHILIQ